MPQSFPSYYKSLYECLEALICHLKVKQNSNGQKFVVGGVREEEKILNSRRSDIGHLKYSLGKDTAIDAS